MHSHTRTRVSLATIASCAMMVAGCATYQGPRIDPTGERLFTWGNPQPVALPAGVPPGSVPVGPPTATPAPGIPIVGAPAAAAPPVAAPLPFGNMQAPPVYSDPTQPAIPPQPLGVAPQVPFAPGTAVPGMVSAFSPAGTVTAVVPTSATVAGGPGATTPPGSTFVRLTPDRLIAPVGTEVFLKAGVAGPDGTLTPNERIEWSVARNGVGQLGSMGLHDGGHLFSWLTAPRTIDAWTAVGHTSFYPISVEGMTPGPFGEARIERGESYVTLTSCNEGVSQVTAFAPDLCQFNQATTSIYWIDAQWIFPAAAVAECGKPYTLTTVVARRTNGVPLAGWIVRYTVGSGGSLGYEGGNTVESRTDANGRASVEVSPAQAGGGVTQIGISIVRPQSNTPNIIPQVELARGTTAITWSANVPAAVPVGPMAPVVPVAPQGPPPLAPPPATPVPAPTPAPMSPGGPAPSLPTSPPSANTTPPYTPPPTGQPRLEVILRAASEEQVPVGQNVRWELTITNRGDGVARHIKVTDRFDAGLEHEKDLRKTHYIERSEGIRDLAPNDSETVPLAFKVVGTGRQCHQATVSADGVDPQTREGCATGVQASLGVHITGVQQRVVGEAAEFNVSVTNTSSSTAANVMLRVQVDPAVELLVENGFQRLQDGSIAIQLGKLESSEKRPVIRLRGSCRNPSQKACARATVTADGGVVSQDEACFEILPAMSNSPPPKAPGL